MNIGKGFHLTYCTNIHPGESWEGVFKSLIQYVLPIKKNVSPDKPFGIGLRLSNQASLGLLEDNNLAEFKEWLDQHGLYVFVINGFPYGSFHRSVVKDEVHQPDWTTNERLEYTKRLAKILVHILPEELDGGISTSPLSYKHWFGNDKQKISEVFQKSTQHIAEVVDYLMHLRKETGRLVHLDIEPEPDGLLENTEEFIKYYENWLLPNVTDLLQSRYGLTTASAHEIIKTHVQLCYDVCHFALVYEEPEVVFKQLAAKGIKIGRAQISAALKADLPTSPEERKTLATQFEAFSESTYLHQVLVRNTDGTITQYPDLPPALDHFYDSEAAEWRSHFHVPVFLERYNQLQSTQSEIIKVLQLLEKNPVTQYLEIETYTWEVLPAEIKLELGASIQRELEWVRSQINVTA